MFTTLNNRYASTFIDNLCRNNFRACCYHLFNAREMFLPRVYGRLVCYLFEHFEISDIRQLREFFDYYSVDLVVCNYIVKLFYYWKGGVFYEKSMENF